jgi:predicted TIM-barrel fold metal-dependent hydrolase
VAPRFDHHQHLLSPAGALLLNAALPAIELPPEAARLVARQQAAWNDQTALAELYAEDALVLSTDAPGWIRGRAPVAAYLATRFARPFRITPVTWKQDGAKAELSGYFTRGEGAETWHFGYVYLGLTKDTASGWRIAVEIPTFPGPSHIPPLDAAALVKSLDAAGIERAVVLSNAFFFDSAGNGGTPDAVAKVRAENDWTAAQAARFPDRLIAFCSFNPLADHALAELDRCAASHAFRGVKLHFHESGVDLLDPEHVAKVRRVFEAANRYRLPILVHVARGATPPYGARHADVFANQLAPAAPDVPVIVAHLWGGGLYSDEAMAVYAKAVAAGRRNLYFDTSGMVGTAGSHEALVQAVSRMRQIGLDRFLFGSDGPDYLDLPELVSVWPQFRERVPLTEAERNRIAGNVAPLLGKTHSEH